MDARRREKHHPANSTLWNDAGKDEPVRTAEYNEPATRHSDSERFYLALDRVWIVRRRLHYIHGDVAAFHACDRKAGLMFAGNAPVMVGLAISAAGSLRLARYFAVGATWLQVLITIALLALDVGEASMIIGSNALIILPCLVLASWAWRLHHLRWMKAERIADRTTAESSPVAPSG